MYNIDPAFSSVIMDFNSYSMLFKRENWTGKKKQKKNRKSE